MLPLSLLAATAALLSASSANANIIESSSLVPCMKNSSFFASLFRVAFTPDNATLTYEINGESQVSSYVVLDLQVSGYGYEVFHKTLDPCKDQDLKGLCPMTSGAMTNMKSNFILSKDTIKEVPSPIYYIPDLDGKVKVWINSTEGNRRPLACVQAEISNGKTVNQKAVSWTLAVITGLCLVISGIMSGFGHFTTSAHVSARALAVMSYFQSQATIGMTAVSMPPIVRAWTQDFQWSMGIVKAHFHQIFATWYQRATGGTPARLFHSLLTTSVHLQKRSNDKGANSQVQIKTLKGMERVSFIANIEITNTFFTGYTFFITVLMVVMLSVAAFKGMCELLVRGRRMDPSRFQEFRLGWKLILKGILLRLILIGCLPMIVLCFWELTRRDSVAEVILAVWMILFIVILLSIATVKITRIARRSLVLHQSPAYILYSDPMVLNKWGFLYVQYKATMTWFLSVVLIHSLIRGMFVALAQRSGTTQAISLFILDLGLLIAVCVVKPYMDKKTNAFNISIASINFFNVLVLLLISGIFGLPALAIGILGVLYFIVNAIFAGTIVIMTIWTAVHACTTKDPDTHYQVVFDDRVSFVKSQTNLETTELEALGKTARGESTMSFYSLQNADSMRFNSSRNGFHHDSRFHGNQGFMDSVDEFGKAPVKAYEAEWRPFNSDPALNASAIRARNAGNMSSPQYRRWEG